MSIASIIQFLDMITEKNVSNFANV